MCDTAIARIAGGVSLFYCIVLYCIVLYGIVLYCTVLYTMVVCLAASWYALEHGTRYVCGTRRFAQEGKIQQIM